MQAAIGCAIGDREAVHAKPAWPRPMLLAAALLSLTLALTLSLGLRGAPPRVVSGADNRLTPAQREGLADLSIAAKGRISAALGADQPGYRITRSLGGGFAASNRAQRLRADFGRFGVLVSSGGAHVRLTLRAAGFGSALQGITAVSPSVRANRATYAHTGVTEWYANGPHGLEQGFTIHRAPSGQPKGPLTLEMALAGNTHVALSDHRSLVFESARGQSLRYAGLFATDARGRTLHSWLEPHSKRVLLRVDAQAARFPLRIDPFIQQGTKLRGNGEIGVGDFGSSVALSADGRTALIGGATDMPTLNAEHGAGAVWVFVRSGSTWIQQAKIAAPDHAAYGEFGYSVSLSADGNTALIGAPSTAEHGNGAAWVFARNGSSWTQQGQKLTSGEFTEGFGFSVALSAHGNVALIGSWDDVAFVGTARVFVRKGSSWIQQGNKLGQGAGFGMSVALAARGRTALIAGDRDARVFVRSRKGWVRQGRPLPLGGEHAPLSGRLVALSANGNTALIGGGFSAAQVFTRTGSRWTRHGSTLSRDAPPEPPTGFSIFGDSVALAGDGRTALVGFPDHGNLAGDAQVFVRSGRNWRHVGTRLIGGGEEGKGLFGNAAALSGDGRTALIGGYNDLHLGAVWVFAR